MLQRNLPAQLGAEEFPADEEMMMMNGSRNPLEEEDNDAGFHTKRPRRFHY